MTRMHSWLVRALLVAAAAASIAVLWLLPRAQAQSDRDAQPGQTLFASRCGFCHGRDAAGGETGPDLTSSPLVGSDVGGDKLIPVIRDGRVENGMPGFQVGASDMAMLVTLNHDHHR